MPNHPIGSVVGLSNGSIFLITRHNPTRPKNCYAGVNVNGEGTEYIFGDGHVIRVIPDYDTSNINLPQDKHDPTHASQMARIAPLHEQPKWAIVAGLNPGDVFRVVTRSGVGMATLVAVNSNAPRRPLIVTDFKGKTVRSGINCVVVKDHAVKPTMPETPGIRVGDAFDLLVMDSCETFTVSQVAPTTFGTMARLDHGDDRRFVLVEDLANNRQM